MYTLFHSFHWDLLYPLSITIFCNIQVKFELSSHTNSTWLVLQYNLYNATSKTWGKTYEKNESILKTTPKWFLDLNKSGRFNNHHFSKTTTPGTSPNCLVVHPTSWHIERWKHDDPIGNPRPGFQGRRIHEFKRGNGDPVGGPRVLRRDDLLRSSHPAPKKKKTVTRRNQSGKNGHDQNNPSVIVLHWKIYEAYNFLQRFICILCTCPFGYKWEKMDVFETRQATFWHHTLEMTC